MYLIELSPRRTEERGVSRVIHRVRVSVSGSVSGSGRVRVRISTIIFRF